MRTQNGLWLRPTPRGADRLELRDREGAAPMIRGYAAVWDEESELVPGLSEVIRAGAFADSLATRDVLAYFNHDTGEILGRRDSGTLRLEEDDHGLAFEIDPPDTQHVRDRVLEPMRRGDLTDASFGFIPREAPWTSTPAGGMRRDVRRADLYEVSIVSLGHYKGAQATYRARSREGLTSELEACKVAGMVGDGSSRSGRADSLEGLERRLRLLELEG